MLRAWVAVTATAIVGCTFDASVDDVIGPDVDVGPDAGLVQGEGLFGFEAEDVAPPPGVVCTDDDLDGFTIVPECGGTMDCDDGDGDTHPQQSGWFSARNLGGSFDYDCDGVELKKDDGFYDQSKFECNSGWDNVVPQCGQQGIWMDCDYDWVQFQCDCSDGSRIQFCR